MTQQEKETIIVDNLLDRSPRDSSRGDRSRFPESQMRCKKDAKGTSRQPESAPCRESEFNESSGA